MIKNKRALVQMLEAIIAIMILLGFFIFIMSKQAEKPNIAEDIYKLERKILKEVSDNTTLREAVLNLSKDNVTVESFIASRLYPAHPALNFSIAICEPPGKECTGPMLAADIYVDDIVIGSLLGQPGLESKILRLFIWVEAARKVEVPAAVCGNNRVEAGEECDDGNTISGDGCSATCKVEPCYPIGEIIYFGTDVGVCEEGQKNCTETGWVIIKDEVVGSDEVCDNLDNDCNGVTDGFSISCYTGPSGTENVGICHGGTKTCTAGSWGSCVGQQTPDIESLGVGNCGDTYDNDCDGYCDDHPLPQCLNGPEPECIVQVKKHSIK